MANNKWSQPETPPPPMFLGKKERDYTKQVNDEIIERVIGQGVFYYPINYKSTNYHPLYGEAIEKTFLPPVRVYALVEWEGEETTTTNYGIDRSARLVINFHRRRLTEDQDLFVREGDFISYGDRFYEIVKLTEPRQLFGQIEHKFEIQATCIQARKGLFTREEPSSLRRIRTLVSSETATGISEQQPTITSNEVQVFCPISGSADVTTLQEYADNSSTYFGRVIYVAKVSGAVTIPPFVQLGKFYFNEVGTWYPSPFIIIPDEGQSIGYDNCE